MNPMSVVSFKIGMLLCGLSVPTLANEQALVHHSCFLFIFTVYICAQIKLGI
jgi:hypothetical protein